jgi:D-3-phosphoglycerate dehydrogenase
MKIAVTSRTLSNRPPLEDWLNTAFGEENVKLNKDDDGLKDDSLIEFLSDVDFVILGTEPFHKEIINSLSNLKVVFKYGVGIDNVDFEACAARDLPVYYKKGTNSDAVAEITLSYIIQLLRNHHISFSSAREGKWNKVVGKELSSARVGIIGVGHVGSCLSRKLNALDCGSIVLNDRRPIHEFTEFMAPIEELSNDLENGYMLVKREDSESRVFGEFRPLENLLMTSDVVSVHIDNEKRDNTKFVNEAFLQRLKRGAYLINTSRGSIMDYDMLEDYIEYLGGVAVDVYPNEPALPKWMVNNPKVITSCHICGSSITALSNGEQFIAQAITQVVPKYATEE